MSDKTIEERERKEARGCICCIAYTLVFVALIVACVAVWIVFGAVFGLLAIAAVLVITALVFFFVLARDARKHKEDQ